MLDENKVGQGLGEKLVMTAQHGKSTSKKGLLKGLQWVLSTKKGLKKNKCQPGESRLIYGFLRCVRSKGKLLLCDNTEDLV